MLSLPPLIIDRISFLLVAVFRRFRSRSIAWKWMKLAVNKLLSSTRSNFVQESLIVSSHMFHKLFMSRSAVDFQCMFPLQCTIKTISWTKQAGFTRSRKYGSYDTPGSQLSIEWWCALQKIAFLGLNIQTPVKIMHIKPVRVSCRIRPRSISSARSWMLVARPSDASSR